MASTQPLPINAPPSSSDQIDDQLGQKWPGWPGHSVFRMVVPVDKLVGVIGRKGELLENLMEKTGARVRLLDRPLSGSKDRIVLISAKEEPEAAFSPAMNAVIRMFKQVNGLIKIGGEGKAYAASSTAFCYMRLLVPSSQALCIIGKHGTMVKSIREWSGASAQVHFNDADADESIIELQGEASKVLKALEVVLAHLRKFLVDQSVIPLFEHIYNALPADETKLDSCSDGYHVTKARAHTPFFESEIHVEPQCPSPGVPSHAEDQMFQNCSSTMGDCEGPFVSQVDHSMHISMRYAEAIIGAEGTNIDYIRRTSGAIISVRESAIMPEEMRVDIRGSSSQVQLAQELIEEFATGHKDSLQGRYGKHESYMPSQLGRSSYPSSPLVEHEPSGDGGYGN